MRLRLPLSFDNCVRSRLRGGFSFRGTVAVSIKIKSNEKKIARRLNDLGRRQLPFAYATTLNDTMKVVKKYTTERTFPKSFEVRNKAFFKASMWGKGSVV